MLSGPVLTSQKPDVVEGKTPQEKFKIQLQVLYKLVNGTLEPQKRVFKAFQRGLSLPSNSEVSLQTVRHIGLRLIILIIDIQLAKMFSGNDTVSLLRAISSSIITVPSQVTELIRYEIPSDHASFKSMLYSKTRYGGLDEAFSHFQIWELLVRS